MTDEKNDPQADDAAEVKADASSASDAPGGRSAPAAPTAADEEILCVLNRSVWHKPFQFLGSLLLMILALVAIFFVPDDWSTIGRYALGGLFALGLVWLLSYLFVTKIAATYTVTRRRCTAELGFVSREIREVEIRHIRNINVKQTILQRVCGIGDVEISSAGGAGIEVDFESVADPLGVRRLIMDRK